jgi:hypothetical protein
MALSSCEAKYIAAVAVVCQGVWLTRLLSDMTGTDSRVPKLLVDNQSAIALCNNPIFHDQSKHIDVGYHYIQECVDEGYHHQLNHNGGAASGRPDQGAQQRSVSQAGRQDRRSICR